MKFIVTYQQEVKINCKNEKIAVELMQQNIPFMEVGGGGTEIGPYSLKNGKFKIIDVKKEK